MPPGVDTRASRTPRRAWLAVPLGAAFIGCVLVPTLPASADATLRLGLDDRTAAPGASFSLPLSVHNTLDSTEVAITEATATAGSSDLAELAVTGLPDLLKAGEAAEAEVTGSLTEDPQESRILVEVEVAYSYPAPCGASEPPSPVPSDLTLPSTSAPAPSGASPSEDPCPTAEVTGTATVSAWVTVLRPTPTPPSSPTPTRAPDLDQSPTPSTSPPPEQSASPRPPASTRPPDSTRPPSPPSSTRPPAPHSPVSTAAPGAVDSPSPAPLPTGAADLPELSAPTDEYAELPLITPGEEDQGDGAATVAQEEERVDPLLTPFVLLLVLMLLLVLATPLGPVRRVRVRHAYVGRRRRN